MPNKRAAMGFNDRQKRRIVEISRFNPSGQLVVPDAVVACARGHLLIIIKSQKIRLVFTTHNLSISLSLGDYLIAPCKCENAPGWFSGVLQV